MLKVLLNKLLKNMKKTIIVTAILGLILGAILAISGYFIYIVITMQNQVTSNTLAINQIVTFINEATKHTQVTK